MFPVKKNSRRPPRFVTLFQVMSAMVLTPARDSDFSRPGFLTARISHDFSQPGFLTVRISHGLNTCPPPVDVIVAPRTNSRREFRLSRVLTGPSVRLFFTVLQRWGHKRDQLGVLCPIGGVAGRESLPHFHVPRFRGLCFHVFTLLHVRVWEKERGGGG